MWGPQGRVLNQAGQRCLYRSGLGFPLACLLSGTIAVTQRDRMQDTRLRPGEVTLAQACILAVGHCPGQAEAGQGRLRVLLLLPEPVAAGNLVAVGRVSLCRASCIPPIVWDLAPASTSAGATRWERRSGLLHAHEGPRLLMRRQHVMRSMLLCCDCSRSLATIVCLYLWHLPRTWCF